MSHSKHNAVSSRSWTAFTAMAIGLSATLVTLGEDSRWAWGQPATPAPDANIESDDAQLARLIRIWDAQARRTTNSGTPPNSCNYRVETAVPMFGTQTTPTGNTNADHCSSPEALIRYACSSPMHTTINDDVARRTNEWISSTNTGTPPSVPSAQSAQDAYYHNRSVARIRRLLGQATNGRNSPRPHAIQGITPLGHLRQQFLDLQASMTQHVDQLRQSTAPAGREQEREHNATFARLKQMIRELQFPNDRDYADQAARHCIGAQANVAFIRRFENGRVRQTVVPCPGVLLMGNAPAALGFMAMAMGKTIDTCALDGTFLNPRTRSRSNDAQQPLSMRLLLQSLRTCTAQRFLPGGANPTAQTHVLPMINQVPFPGAGNPDPVPANTLNNPNPQRPHCGPCLNVDLVTGTTAHGNYDHSNEALGVFLAMKALEGTRISLESRPAHLQLPAPATNQPSTTPTSDPSTQSLLQFLCTDRPANGGAHHLAAIDRARIVLESSSVFKNQVLRCTGAQINTTPTTSRAGRGRTVERATVQVNSAEALPRGCKLDSMTRTLVTDPNVPSALAGAAARTAAQAPVATPATPATPVRPPAPAAQPVVAPTPTGPAAPTPEAPAPAPTPEPPSEGSSTTGADGAGPLTTFASATGPQLTARREAIEAAISAQNPACLALASRFTPAPVVFTERCRSTNNNDGRFDLDLHTGSGDSGFPKAVSQGGYTVDIGCQMRCMCGDNRCWSPEATYRGQTQPTLATANRFPTVDPALAAAITNDRTYYEFQRPENGRFSLVAKACLRGVAGPETLSGTACRSSNDTSPQRQDNQTFYAAGEPRTISLLGETSGQILDYNCTVRCACSGEGTSRAAANPPQCLAFYTRGATRAIDEASRTALQTQNDRDDATYTITMSNGSSHLNQVDDMNTAEQTAGHLDNAVYLLRMPASTMSDSPPPATERNPATPTAPQANASGNTPSTTATPANPTPLTAITRITPPTSPVEIKIVGQQNATRVCQNIMNRALEHVLAILEHTQNNHGALPTWLTSTQGDAWGRLTSGITINDETTVAQLMCRNNQYQSADVNALFNRQLDQFQILIQNAQNQVQAVNCNTSCVQNEGSTTWTPRSVADTENPIAITASAARNNEGPAKNMLQHYCRERGHELYVRRHTRDDHSFSCNVLRNLSPDQRSFELRVPPAAQAVLPERFRNKTITCRLRPISDTDTNPRCLQIDEQTPEPEFEIEILEPRATQTTGAAAPVTPTAVATAATPAPNPSVTAPPSPAPVAAASATPAAGPTPTRAPAAAGPTPPPAVAATAPRAPASPTSGTTAATPQPPPPQTVTAPQLTPTRATTPTPPPAVTTTTPAARPAATPVATTARPVANPAPAASPPAPIAITLPDIAVDTQPYRHQPYNDPSITIQLPTPNQLIDTCNNLTENNQRDVIALLHYYRTHNNTPPNWLREGRLAAWQELVRRRPITPQTGEAEFMCSADNNQLNAEPLARLLNRAVHQIPILAQQTTPSLTTTAYLCTQTCTVSITAGTTNTAALRSDVTANTTQPTLNAQTDNNASLHLLQHLCQQTAYERWVPAGSRLTLTCGGLAKAMITNGDTNTTPFEMTLSPPAREAIAVLKNNNNRVFCHLNTNNYDPSTGVPDRTNRRPRCLDAASDGGGSIRPEFYISIRTESAARPPAR